MKGFNPIAKFMQEVREFMKATTAELNSIKETQKQLNAKVDYLVSEVEALHTKVEALHTKVDYLVSEVSRYKNDSDELLVSVYAFCTQEGVSFSPGDMKRWGRRASFLSKVKGAKVEKTDDPRFGNVNLYERWVLEEVIGEE